MPSAPDAAAEADQPGIYANAHGVCGPLSNQLHIGEEALLYLRRRLPDCRFPDLLRLRELSVLEQLRGIPLRE